MKHSFVGALVLAAGLALAGCSALGTGGAEASKPDVRPAAADAISACGAWRQYADPEPGQPSTDTLLPLAESDAHSAAEKSAEYARLGAAMHDAVHRLVPTGGATSPPSEPVRGELLAAVSEACEQVPREYHAQ